MKILLLILISFSSPALSKMQCPVISDTETKTELENLSIYISKITPIKEHQVFIQTENNHYTKITNSSHFENIIQCAYKKINSMELEKNDFYELLLLRLDYLSEKNQRRLTKSEIIYEATFDCFDHENFDLSETSPSYLCASEIAERLNNHRQPSEFSESWFQRIEALAKKGNLIAQYNMVEINRYGVGTKIDLISAYAWSLVASTVNPPFGKSQTDEMYDNFNFDEKRKAQLLAMKYLRDYSKIYERPSITILQ